jgi:hypothetical protein
LKPLSGGKRTKQNEHDYEADELCSHFILLVNTIGAGLFAVRSKTRWVVGRTIEQKHSTAQKALSRANKK